MRLAAPFHGPACACTSDLVQIGLGKPGTPTRVGCSGGTSSCQPHHPVTLPASPSATGTDVCTHPAAPTRRHTDTGVQTHIPKRLRKTHTQSHIGRDIAKPCRLGLGSRTSLCRDKFHEKQGDSGSVQAWGQDRGMGNPEMEGFCFLFFFPGVIISPVLPPTLISLVPSLLLGHSPSPSYGFPRARPIGIKPTTGKRQWTLFVTLLLSSARDQSQGILHEQRHPILGYRPYS